MKRLFRVSVRVLWAIALAVGFWHDRGEAAERVWRIGFLSVATRDSFHDTFFQGLKELGYVEGRNFVLESRVAAANEKRLAEVAAQLAKLPVDVIVARG